MHRILTVDDVDNYTVFLSNSDKKMKIMLDIRKAKEYNNKVRLIESIAL